MKQNINRKQNIPYKQYTNKLALFYRKQNHRQHYINSKQNQRKQNHRKQNRRKQITGSKLDL